MTTMSSPQQETHDRLEREREFHNEVFADGARKQTEKYYDVARSTFAEYARAIRKDVGVGTRVLEYGCGPGSFAYYLADSGALVDGIDISDFAISEARKEADRRNLKNVRFEIMDAEALQYENATFDAICGTGILHHLSLERSLDEIHRVLKPGGVATFLEPLGHNPLINFYRRLTPRLRTSDEHPLVREDLQLMSRKFPSSEFTHRNLLTLGATPLKNLPGFSTVLSGLELADRGLFAMLPPLKMWSWMVLISLRKT